VLVHLFSAVSCSDFNSVFTASASFGWLLSFLSGGTYRLVLKAYVCSPLREPGHLFNPCSTIFNYFRTVLVYFEFIVRELTLFRL
jgi:hypothetical protein